MAKDCSSRNAAKTRLSPVVYDVARDAHELIKTFRRKIFRQTRASVAPANSSRGKRVRLIFDVSGRAHSWVGVFYIHRVRRDKRFRDKSRDPPSTCVYKINTKSRSRKKNTQVHYYTVCVCAYYVQDVSRSYNNLLTISDWTLLFSSV